jgi:hypothetical protein
MQRRSIPLILVYASATLGLALVPQLRFVLGVLALICVPVLAICAVLAVLAILPPRRRALLRSLARVTAPALALLIGFGLSTLHVEHSMRKARSALQPKIDDLDAQKLAVGQYPSEVDISDVAPKLPWFIRGNVTYTRPTGDGYTLVISFKGQAFDSQFYDSGTRKWDAW